MSWFNPATWFSPSEPASGLREDAERKRVEILRQKALSLRTAMAKAGTTNIFLAVDETKEGFTFTATDRFRTAPNQGDRRYAEAHARQGHEDKLFVAGIEYANSKPFVLVEYFPSVLEKRYGIGEYAAFENHAVGILRAAKDQLAA